MLRIFFLITLLTFAWTSIVQAFNLSDNSFHQPILTSKAIVTLANNKMDVNKTLDEITTLETLKEMAIAAGSAATVHHVGGKLGIGRSGKEVVTVQATPSTINL